MKFSFGKKEKTIIEWAKISLVLESIVEFLHKWLKIDKKNLWALIDELQRFFYKKGWIDETLNDYVINTPELLNQRIIRDVDKAIKEYEALEEKEPVNMKNEIILKNINNGKYTEQQSNTLKSSEYYELPKNSSEAQNLLGGPMGIRAPWIKKDK